MPNKTCHSRPHRRPAACPRDPEQHQCSSGSRGQAAGRRGFPFIFSPSKPSPPLHQPLQE